MVHGQRKEGINRSCTNYFHPERGRNTLLQIDMLSILRLDPGFVHEKYAGWFVSGYDSA